MAGSTPAILAARRQRRGRSTLAPPIVPREGKTGKSPGAAVGAVADRAPLGRRRKMRRSTMPRSASAAASSRPPLSLVKTAKRLKTLETARAGYWRELAWIWDRRHVRSYPSQDLRSGSPHSPARIGSMTRAVASGRHPGHRRHRHTVAIEGVRGAASIESSVIGPLRSLRSASPRSYNGISARPSRVVGLPETLLATTITQRGLGRDNQDKSGHGGNGGSIAFRLTSIDRSRIKKSLP